ATASGKRPRPLQVRDVSGARDCGNAPERDVLHVTDHGDAHGEPVPPGPPSRLVVGAYFTAAAAGAAVAELSGGAPCWVSAGGFATSGHPVFGFGPLNQRLISMQV